MKKTAVALLSLALALQATADVHMLPVGEFVGRDGRPGEGLKWKLSEAQGRALAAKLNARHTSVQFNVDYEHQTLLAEKNGQPAPASGWSSAFEWREGEGLFALNMRWTAKAKQMIEAEEYKYLSPVIVFDKKTGEVLDVLNAALVAIPNLDLNPVAQERVARMNADFLTTPPEQLPMNPVLMALLKALGLPETEATTAEQATAAVAALKTSADQAAGLTTEIAALKAATGNPDPGKWVSLERFTQLGEQVAALSASQVDRQVDEILNAALAAGKCVPGEMAAYRDVGKHDLAQLKALLDARPVNPMLAGLNQTGGKPPVKADPNAAATSDELAMCKNLGMTLEEFRKGAETAAA